MRFMRFRLQHENASHLPPLLPKPSTHRTGTKYVSPQAVIYNSHILFERLYPPPRRPAVRGIALGRMGGVWVHSPDWKRVLMRGIGGISAAQARYFRTC
jgi:hypothetical protein